MENMKPRRANEVGPAGQRAAQNLEQLREESRLSQDELAAGVERLGRPMTRQIVSKTEAAARRIDLDDLMAFALALRTTPNRLLLTPTAHANQAVEIAVGHQVPELDAWMWAEGERPLDREFDAPQLQANNQGERVRRFIRESRPHRTPDPPPADPITDHPEVAKAVVNLVRRARAAEIDVQPLHYAVDLAYHLEAVGLAYTAEGED
jgi:transcriptional regulator with XRE-family HTH domain